MILKKANVNFQETLNPADFFLVMNNFLELNLLTIIPMIREIDKAAIENEKHKKVNSDVFKELTDSIITLYVSDVAKYFAEDFLDIVLKYGKDLDVNKLMKELKDRIEKQATDFESKEGAKKQVEETEQRTCPPVNVHGDMNPDLERIARLKAKPQRYDSKLVEEVKEYVKNVEKLKEKEAKKDEKT